jgi:hypothetical protein
VSEQLQREKPVSVQASLAKLAMEAFDEAVLDWRSRCSEVNVTSGMPTGLSALEVNPVPISMAIQTGQRPL